MNRQYITASEAAEILGVSKGKAYQIFRELNQQLQENGFVVIAGKCNRHFFEEKCCYGGLEKETCA